MGKTFAAAIDAWILKSRKRMDATFQTALQSTAEQATLPKGQGGNLPVDTAFLANSFVGDVGSMPTGPSDPSTDQQGNQDISLVIARAHVGDVFYMGFAANYAGIQEARNGFVESAAQKWPSYVRSAARQAIVRIR